MVQFIVQLELRRVSRRAICRILTNFTQIFVRVIVFGRGRAYAGAARIDCVNLFDHVWRDTTDAPDLEVGSDSSEDLSL